MTKGFVQYQHSSVQPVQKKWIEVPSLKEQKVNVNEKTINNRISIIRVGFSAESNLFEIKSNVEINETLSNC